jgi:DMSO/TMAO reductase YedYZ molybdopterin-dependent catalytic subunit
LGPSSTFLEAGTPGSNPNFPSKTELPEDNQHFVLSMIIREKEPANLEMPFSTLEGFITPNDRFYVRNHFPVPQIDVQTWRLRIEGAVDQPTEFTYDQLLAMEKRTIASTLECAGNGRVFLVPKVKGTQWELGAVGNARWTGISLGDLLQRVRIRSEALVVILEGADSGTIDELPRPAGKIHFARSLPKAKAMDDVVLAFEMNGETLSASHGFPLRAIVPGWYAVASIKWLQRIIVADTPLNGFYETVDYAYWQRSELGPALTPINELQVKAEIARPGMNEVVPAGNIYRVTGAAWTSDSEITKVEFSVDGGCSWQGARLTGEAIRNAWRLWEFDWKTPAEPGKYTLMARAVDARGRTQPDKRDADRGTYMINHCLPIDVQVR